MWFSFPLPDCRTDMPDNPAGLLHPQSHIHKAPHHNCQGSHCAFPVYSYHRLPIHRDPEYLRPQYRTHSARDRPSPLPVHYPVLCKHAVQASVHLKHPVPHKTDRYWMLSGNCRYPSFHNTWNYCCLKLHSPGQWFPWFRARSDPHLFWSV